MRRAAAWLDDVAVSAFTRIERLVREHPDVRPTPLHQGKTWFPPAFPSDDADPAQLPLAPQDHAPPGGVPVVREEATVYLKSRCGRVADPQDVVMVNGATHGIASVLNMLLEPGDEVLLLSPQWLFATGIVRAARGRPVEVPVFSGLALESGVDLGAMVDAAVTPRTRAVYFNSPNNPTGVSLGPQLLQALAAVCERHDLWIVADNAYENYDWTDAGFVDIATVDGAEARTFSVYSLSKTFAMPGYRTGFVATPPGWGERLGLAVLYNVYSQATVSQGAALAALRTPAAVLDERRRLVAGAWRYTHEILRVPHTSVQGGLYTLLDLSSCAGGAHAFLARCLEAGVTLAPGSAFGAGLHRHARLCFTAVEPTLLGPALRTVNAVFEEALR